MLALDTMATLCVSALKPELLQATDVRGSGALQPQGEGAGAGTGAHARSPAAGGGAAVCRGVTSRARVPSASRRQRRVKWARECSMRSQSRRRRRASASEPRQ